MDKYEFSTNGLMLCLDVDEDGFTLWDYSGESRVWLIDGSLLKKAGSVTVADGHIRKAAIEKDGNTFTFSS